MRTSPLSIFLMVLPGAGFIFVFVTAAIVMIVMQSFGLYSVTGETGFTLAYWSELASKGFLDSFLFSLKIGLGSAFGTLVFSYPLAIFLRRPIFGSRLIGTILKIPLFVPALVAAFLILNVLAFNGVLNNALVGIGIIDKPLRLLNDGFGWNVLIIQIWKNLPFQLLIISAALQSIQTDIEDAARNLGASPFRVIWHIIVPLSAPGAIVAVVLVFILTFGDYAITKIAGPVYPTSLSVLMYTEAFTLNRWGVSACIGTVIMLFSLIFVGFYAWTANTIKGAGR